MRVGFVLSHNEREHRRALLDLAATAEARGLDSLWIPESWGAESVSLLGALAVSTRRLRLGTGIVNVFSRTPGLLAQTFATLDELSGGRLLIGLGTSGPRVVEGWHGLPFQRPVRRLREVVDVVRLAIAGERVDYSGEVVRLAGFRLMLEPVRARIPIYLATLKAQGLRLTGEIADGWLPTHLSLAHLPWFRGELAAGAARAGRDLATLDVAPITLGAVTADGDAARALAAGHLAYYVGGMGAFYHELMHRYGFGEEADRVRERWRQNDRAGAARQVSRAMLDALTVCGTETEARDAADARRAAGIGALLLMPPHGTPVEVARRTLEALAP
jgi:F420-dependent oxidoreductase-like protein